MANKKVSQLLSKPSVLVTDLFPIADPTTGQLFKTTISDLGTAIGSGVSSVNTLVGAVVLDTDDIQELASPTNKWFTDTRARAAISAGTGISYNSGTGVITNAVTSGQIATALGYTPANGADYLPLAGGTMGGAIFGTIATFASSTSVTALGITLSGATGDGVKITHSAGRAFNIQSSGTGFGILINNETASTSAPFTIQKQGLDKITFTDGGAGTFSGLLSGVNASFTSSGSSDTVGITHSSGSGIALNITKGGNGEGIYVNKSSGSGNAVTIVGTLNATTLVKNGGTSSQFLKADGSVDSSTYLTTGTAASTYLALAGGTLTGAVIGTRLSLSQNSADTTLSISNLGTGRAFSVLGTSYFSSDIIFGSLSNGVLKANALGGLVLATAGTDYQAPLSGTGFVKISGSTISYDNSTYVPTSRTLTINGTALDLSADRSWTIASYSLPTATDTVLGGVKIGSGVTITSGVISVSTDYQAPLSGTGFVKISGSTISYDNSTYLTTSSASSTYLALAGGTLTGALNGTSALFSGAVRANNPAEGATGEGLIAGQSFKIDGTGTSQKAVMYLVSNVLSDTYASGLTAQFANFAGDKAFGFNLNTSGGFELYVKNTSFNKALTISNTNAVTLTGALSGTSATFSGQLHIPNSSTGTLGGLYFDYNANAASRTWQIVSDYDVFGDFQIRQSTTQTGSTYSKILGFSPTGAATFNGGTSAAPATSGTTTNSMVVFKPNDGNNAIIMGAYPTAPFGNWIQSQGTNALGTTYPLILQPIGGNVGIGTTAPASYYGFDRTLSVENASSAEIQLKATGGTNTLASFGAATNGTYLQSATQPLITVVNGAERMRITSAGNVGIGTTAPLSLLQVGSIGNATVRFGTSSTTNTSATYAFVAWNSSGSDILSVRGDGLVTLPSLVSTWTTGNLPNMWANPSSGDLYRSTASSMRYKENIIDWDVNGLETILALKPKTFTYKKDYYNNPNKQFLGLIAEEVSKVSSYLADYENEDGSGQVENVRYANIVVPLIKAVQELKAELDTLKNK